MRFGPEHGQEGVSAMARNYRIISGDSHLQIASERWTHRVPAKYRDQAPRTIRMPDGTDGTIAGEGSRTQVFSQGGLVGLPYKDRSPIGGRFETAPGAGSRSNTISIELGTPSGTTVMTAAEIRVNSGGKTL